MPHAATANLPPPCGAAAIDPEARADAQDRRRLQHDLRLAVAAGDFVLHYQPRVCLRTGALNGAEALVRWPHRKRGLLGPDRFIPIAEQTGLIDALGAWVLRQGCADAAAWPDAQAVLSINVAPHQLRDGRFATGVATALETYGLPPERLELELTESTLLEVDTDILFMLSGLRDLGVGLALDDFGTGYASLAMVRRLPLTVVKIDQSLVRNVLHDREDAAIVGAVLATTRAMGLRAVAEGVETAAQRDRLAEYGADDGQGYLFGRPRPGIPRQEPLAA